MTIFDHWREQEMQSTMQRLQESNARLMRWKKINEAVALVAWCLAFVMAMYLTIGDKL